MRAGIIKCTIVTFLFLAILGLIRLWAAAPLNQTQAITTVTQALPDYATKTDGSIAKSNGSSLPQAIEKNAAPGLGFQSQQRTSVPPHADPSSIDRDTDSGGNGSAYPVEHNLASDPNKVRSATEYEVSGFFEPPSTWILAPGNVASTIWDYTTVAPGPTEVWTSNRYIPGASWKKGSPGFWSNIGYVDPALPSPDKLGTVWPGSDLWLRNTFVITNAADMASAIMWGRIDDTMKVYINGVLALEEKGGSSGYRYYGITAGARATILPGARNTIAVHAHNVGGPGYFDLGITTNVKFSNMPSTGEEESGYENYGEVVRKYMLEHGIPAGVIAVVKNGKTIVNRGYGWSDCRLTLPLEANAIMRLASNDKIITKGALRRVLRDSNYQLTTRTYIFRFLDHAGRLAPIKDHAPDPRKATITIQQLLDHTSGLQELPQSSAFHSFLGVPPNVDTTVEDSIRWTYNAAFSPRTGDSPTKPWIPGNKQIYCSIGYATLRYFVHVVSGDLQIFLKKKIFRPRNDLDLGSSEIIIARERQKDRDLREPWYATLEVPNDRWLYLDNFTALASSALAYARYLQYYDMATGMPLDNSSNGLWTFAGGMAGSSSYACQDLANNVSIVIIFNINGVYNDVADQLFFHTHH